MPHPDRIRIALVPGAASVLAGFGLIMVTAVGLAAVTPALAPLLIVVAGFPPIWIGLTALASIAMARAVEFEVVDQPPNLRAMSLCPFEARASNRSRRLPVLDLSVAGQAAIGGHELATLPEVLAAVLAPGAVLRCRWSVIARQRAPLRLGPFRAVVALPGSLIRATAHFDHTIEIPVLPVRYVLQPEVMELLAGRRLAVGRVMPTPAAMEEFVGARLYRPGDNPRLIHRVLSLRAPNYPADLFVREFEDPSSDDVSIVLDTVLVRWADRTLYRYRFEKALCFANALCLALVAGRYKVRFLCQRGKGDLFDQRLRPVERDLARFEGELAKLTLAGDRPAVLDILLRECRRCGPAVIFISLREQAEEDLQPRLPIVSVTPNLVPVFTREVIWR